MRSSACCAYIVGCILGRYSPYVEGLLFAGGEWDDAQIRARIEEGAKGCDFADPSLELFYPDGDGIVPITDEAYFSDDIVERTVEFIRKVYGEETLEENLAFVASTLVGRGETPREVIRNYYLNDFYADHLKTYQKRPIYWLCDSGKAGAFRALFYLHRYDRDTVGRIRMDYVHELQDRLRVQLDDARRAQESGEGRAKAQAGQTRAEAGKAADELGKYEEQVHHLADMRIPLDLDDGVKINYAKLGCDTRQNQVTEGKTMDVRQELRGGLPRPFRNTTRGASSCSGMTRAALPPRRGADGAARRAHPHHAGERVVHPAAADRERLRAGEYSALLPEDVCALAG